MDEYFKNIVEKMNSNIQLSESEEELNKLLEESAKELIIFISKTYDFNKEFAIKLLSVTISAMFCTLSNNIDEAIKNNNDLHTNVYKNLKDLDKRINAFKNE